jgi:hypothetical protein
MAYIDRAFAIRTVTNFYAVVLNAYDKSAEVKSF